MVGDAVPAQAHRQSLCSRVAANKAVGAYVMVLGGNLRVLESQAEADPNKGCDPLMIETARELRMKRK